MSMIGKNLGNFILEAEIGKGGMGEVYQAKDQKLGRDVAIKVLPEEFARDADRVARFQREAKLLASLNHPNIAAIYGLEEADGTHFLVLELVEGQTLAERIKTGPIPVEEALKLALQIAEALEAAHEKGVIHRDLKPANIKVTPDGKVKVLDFGLAKAYAGDSENMNLSNSPTLSDMATQQGVILGTAAYMPPEQAKGKTVDKRADIWAFGVVLFEMLAGRQLFSGENVSETLAAVIKSEPEWNSLPPNLHPRIRLMLERCLEKDPKRRYGAINDACVDIEKVLADPGGVFIKPITAVKPKKKLRLGIPWIAAVFIFGLIIAGITVWKLKPTEPHKIMRFDYHLPTNQKFSQAIASIPSLAVSPDNSRFVYGTTEGLYIRSMEQLDATLIPNTNGNSVLPFFSPDGQWVGYWSSDDNKLKKIATSGGAPVTLCDIQINLFSEWSADNTIIYGTAEEGIMRVSADSGTPETLIKLENGACAAPQTLPDGKSVLFTTFGGANPSICLLSLESGEIKELFSGMSGRYLPTGHIVYLLDNILHAIQFDIDKYEVKGGAVPLVEDVNIFAISESGTLVYIPGTSDFNTRTLVWVDREGNEEPIAAVPNDYLDLNISPDGEKLALVVAGENRDIYTYDLVHGTLSRLTFNTSRENAPLWTPDGQRIVFRSSRDGIGSIYWKLYDGTGVTEFLGGGKDTSSSPDSWSGDGKTIITGDLGIGGFNIGLLPLEDDHEWKPLLNENHNEADPQVSPDGRWIAYVSDETKREEIYVRPFPEINMGKWQISTNGGSSPLWSPDGKELYFINDDAVMVVSITATTNFSHETPKILFKGKYFSSFYRGSSHTPWDIHPYSKKFLMIKEAESTNNESASETPSKINIILNWDEEVKKRVKAD